MRQSKISGVLVEFEGEPDMGTPPLLFVHGGAHGSWTWGKMMPWFAARGWACAAINWYGHHGSDPLPRPERVTRSITDVTREIGIVVAHLGRTPVLIGHSMGGLACLAYAARANLAALVLLAPVVPAGFAKAPVELPVDLTVMWTPPPPIARTGAPSCRRSCADEAG
jgi:pimeloyl-ACP methyl ester carboxylesterase